MFVPKEDFHETKSTEKVQYVMLNHAKSFKRAYSLSNNECIYYLCDKQKKLNGFNMSRKNLIFFFLQVFGTTLLKFQHD